MRASCAQGLGNWDRYLSAISAKLNCFSATARDYSTAVSGGSIVHSPRICEENYRVKEGAKHAENEKRMLENCRPVFSGYS
jgi:hypothetical protein